MAKMYKNFSMGHRLELYIDARHTVNFINLAKASNIEAKIIGLTKQA